MKTNIIAASLFLILSLTIYDAFFCSPIEPKDILCAQNSSNSVQFGDKAEYFSAPSAQYIYWLAYQKNNNLEKFKDIVTNKDYMKDFVYGLSAEMEKENPTIQSLQQTVDSCRHENIRLLLTYNHKQKDSISTIVFNSTKYTENIKAVNLNRQRHQYLLAWKQWAELGKLDSKQATFSSFYNLMASRKYYTSHSAAAQLLFDSLNVAAFWEKYSSAEEKENYTLLDLARYRYLSKDTHDLLK